MKTWTISSDGQDLGSYAGETEREAIEAMWTAAGYSAPWDATDEDGRLLCDADQLVVRESTTAAISREQVRALRTEAAEAGDLEQVAVCDRALEGDSDAILECSRVIADALAQQ